MNSATRRGITLVEVLIATSIAGILTGIAVPTVVALRQATVAQTALAALRAVDVAVNMSCARDSCASLIDSCGSSSVATQLPTSLKAFLPTGFKFPSDTSMYALQLEMWTIPSTPAATLCLPTCPAAATPTGPENPGFTNTAGYAAPPTVTVSVSIVTRDGNVAQALYHKAGGAPPVFITSQHVWKFSYPVLVAVPATI